MNDRYVTNAQPNSTTPSDNENDDTTASYSTFPSDNDSGSDDFFISRVQPQGPRKRTKSEALAQANTDSASDDFYISKGPRKSKNNIIQGNVVIANTPILPKSNSGIIRATSNPGTKEDNRKSRKKSTKKDSKKDRIPSPRLLEPEPEFAVDLEELPEFSEIYDSSIASSHPRGTRSNTLTDASSIRTDGSPDVTAPLSARTRVQQHSRTPSTASLLSVGGRLPSSNAAAEHPGGKLPASVKFQWSDSPSLPARTGFMGNNFNIFLFELYW